MEELIYHPVRLWMSGAITAAGAPVLTRSLHRERSAIALPWADPRKPFSLLSAFRLAIIGLAVSALGLAWATQQLCLAVLALIVRGAETFESTMAPAAMRYTKIRGT